MTRVLKVMLLIDADNVSVDVIEQGIEQLVETYGALPVRRAHCTPESAVKHQKLFKRLAIRPVVNLAAGKNSTDIALAVDAIDLAHTERPDVMVIASSDSDFAPLVTRLREKGCRVIGIGQQGKTGDETQAVYDEYTVIAHRKTRPAAKALPRPAVKAAARTAARRQAEPAPAVAAPPPAPTAAKHAETSAAPAPAAAKKSARARRKPAAAKSSAAAASKTAAAPPPAPAPKVAPAPAAAAASSDAKSQQILAALPALSRGDTVELKVAAQKLKEAGLLARGGASTKLFGRYPELFELVPTKGPNAVRLRVEAKD